MPIEASGCVVSELKPAMYLSTDDDKNVYIFPIGETISAPALSKISEVADNTTGFEVYRSQRSEFLFVGQGHKIAVYANPLSLVGIITLKDCQISGFKA